MNREIESHFSSLPQVDVKRSKMSRPHTHKTAFMCGDLIPIYMDSDILPGDTVKMDMGSIIRMSTPIFPVMDNCYADLFFFFVPKRLLWDHFREFWGENRLTHWEQQTEYEEPQIEAPSGGWNVNSLADYMGLPIGVDNISVSHLPFRAYCKCVNDWFIDENLKDPAMITMDETVVTGTNYSALTYDYVTDLETGAKPFKVAKFHDYFTSCLPAPQKGPAVTIPIGLEGMAPVYPTNEIIDYDTYGSKAENIIRAQAGASSWEYSGANRFLGSHKDTGVEDLAQYENPTPSFVNGKNVPVNLHADLAGVGMNGAVATINALRQAIAIQEFYEAQARGGWAKA